jgi:hypothetical protein
MVREFHISPDLGNTPLRPDPHSLQWKTDYRNMTTWPHWTLRDKTLLGIGTFHTVTCFYRVEVRKVSGRGRPTRSSN